MTERMIFNHEDPIRFIVGTVGQPGERSFFLQVTSALSSTTVSIEKSQVAALQERMHELIGELRRNKLASLDELSIEPSNDLEPLSFPIDEEFHSGIIGISWDQDEQRITVEIQSLTDSDVDEILTDDSLGQIEFPPDVLRCKIRIHQARSFIERSRLVLNSGRPACPFCGLPVDQSGHLCPRANGYKR